MFSELTKVMDRWQDMYWGVNGPAMTNVWGTCRDVFVFRHVFWVGVGRRGHTFLVFFMDVFSVRV